MGKKAPGASRRVWSGARLAFFLFFLKKTKNSVFIKKNAKKNTKSVFFLKVAQFRGT
jgi:hypothetical protein